MPTSLNTVAIRGMLERPKHATYINPYPIIRLCTLQDFLLECSLVTFLFTQSSFTASMQIVRGPPLDMLTWSCSRDSNFNHSCTNRVVQISDRLRTDAFLQAKSKS